MTGSDEDQLPETQRLDKWLWFARVTKSRNLAAQLIQDGKVRVNRTKVIKPSQTVRSGDVLTIAVRGSVEVLKVLAPGVRRGPPPEARQLYQVVSSVSGGSLARAAADAGVQGANRPTKRERRLAQRLAKQDG
jgi:ribosome-associated heat shock protein Hsp15